MGTLGFLAFVPSGAEAATYQFTPTAGQLVVGTENQITSATAAAATDGTNVGSWKGTLADDGFHWVVTGINGSGLDVQLTVGNVALNGANILMIQTELDGGTTNAPATLVQICDWVSATGIDNVADAQCTTGGWRTLNNRKTTLATAAVTAYHWQIYDGYWASGNTPISTPLTNFVNGSNQIKVRYYSVTNPISTLAIDYLRIYAVINPVYTAAGMTNLNTNTGVATGVAASITARAVVKDSTYFYTVGDETGSNWRIEKRRLDTGTLETAFDTDGIVSGVAATNIARAIAIDATYMYVVGDDSTPDWRIEKRRLDTGALETAFDTDGIVTGAAASSIASGIKIDATYMYVVGYENAGVNWRIEKRRLDTGALETAFDTDGIITVVGNDVADAIALDATYMYVVGYDGAALNWRIEKRLLSTGALETAFDTDGIITVTAGAAAYAIAIDATYLYAAGFDDTANWRIEKRRLDTGALETAFDTDGIVVSDVASDTAYAITIDPTYMYVVGTGSMTQWRIEKRRLDTGALETAFDTDGIISGPLAVTTNYGITLDSSSFYVVGDDQTPDWRMEKRSLTTGALDAAANGFGLVASGLYTDTTVVTQGASDNLYLQVAGTTTSIADFYLPFKNVKTYTGMNTILVRAETSCSVATVGLLYKPKIYNFTTSAWEDLTTTGILCSVTDATNAWAKNNVVISDYLSNGEIRVGFYGSGNSTTSLRVDQIYIMLGTVNSDVAACEISFGSNSLNDCAATRTLDMTGTTTAWQILTEDESTNRGTGEANSYYAWDTDADGVVGEEAASSHVKFAVTPPPNAQVTAFLSAARYMSGVGGTVHIAVREYGGGLTASGIAGSFSWPGTAAGTTTLTYSDNITVASVLADRGYAGFMINPEDHLDTVNNQMWMRLATFTDGVATNNSVNQWDFAMVSLQWVEDAAHPTRTYQFTPSSGQLVTGTENQITSATAAANEGTNVGSWKGTIADDAFHWVVTGTASGVDAQLTVGGVALNGANTLMIQTDFDLDSATLATAVQICDWVSATGVDNAADARCTGGGWRTLNNRKTTIVATATTAYHWQIYDGYFASGNTPISTPLTNFVNGSNQIKVRYFSTGNSVTDLAIDFLRIYAVINPVYTAAGMTNLTANMTAGVVTSDSTSTTAYAVAKDSTYFYTVGNEGAGINWRIEKRRLDTGGLETAFGAGGISSGTATTNIAYAIAIDATYMYVVGDNSTPDWRIEKRRLDTGALETAFDTDGIVTGVAATTTAYAIAIDATYMYVVGNDSTPDWRIEKRRLDTGALETAFNTTGIVTGAAASEQATGIALDATYLYVVGYDSNTDWRIEKRLLSTGALDTNFGTSGVVTGDPASSIAFGIALDTTYMYVVGQDSTFHWRIEKRLLSTGALETTNFGTSGVVTGAFQTANAIALDATYLYVVGYDSTPDFRIEKRLLSTGALDTNFGTSGVVTGVAVTKNANAIAIDATSLYVVGDDSTPDWRMEKRSLTTGALDAAANGFGLVATGLYTDTTVIAQGASDNLYLQVAGTATSVADFYLPFKNIKTYTGMNTILVRAETSCSVASAVLSYKPKIYNFTTTAWEDLTTGFIVCSTTDATNMWAKNNVTMTNYISNGEIRVGFYGNISSTTSLRVDQIYVMLGTTNTDASACEISFGSNSANDCTATRTLDMTGGAASRLPYAIAKDATYMYVVGQDDNFDWRIEKRRLDTGALETAFGTSGVVTGAASSSAAYGIALDATYMYVVGNDDSSANWRIEKRRLDTGALETAFDTDGIVTGTSASQVAYGIALDATYMYVVGYNSSFDWRIEKRRLDTGALETAFDTDGIVTAAAASNVAVAITIDATYMYVVGYDDNIDWRIEKRRLDTGALETAFDTDGIVTGDPASTMPRAIAIDATYMYVVGNDGTPDWRIEKRRLDTGALETAFDTDGIVTGAAASNIAYAITLDATYLYVVGDQTGLDWRIEKRLLTTGALETAFDTDGIFSGAAATVTAYGLATDSTSLYVVGDDGADWRIEKRLLTTGALNNTSFGAVGVAGATDIVWQVLTKDESTTMGTGEANSYYALDTDADAVVEEAGASHVKFSVTQPTAGAVTGVFFATRFMSGAAGTVNLNLNDYSGLTGTLGGFSLIGAGATTAQVYTDNITVAGVLTGGTAGWMTNPEDSLSTVNNQIWLRMRTAVDGATTNNSVNQWDFAMVSLQWIDTSVPRNQAAYRWYANADSANVGAALAVQDTAATAPALGTAFRLRLLELIGVSQLGISGENFKLQVAPRSGTCDTSFSGETYADVATASGVIRYQNNTTPVDGATLTANANDPSLGSTTLVNQTYEEANNFTNSVAAIPIGQAGKWDFALVTSAAPSSTAYCLRAVKSDGTLLDRYSVIPEVTTAAVTATWDGGGIDGTCGGAGTANNWSCANNWSGDVVPAAGDVATFNATSTKNVTIDGAINVRGIAINSGYTGTISQATGIAVTAGSSGITQAAGTFSGSNAAITVNGPFVLSGGEFKSTTGTMTVTGNWTHTAGGTFTHRSGTVAFTGATDATVDVMTNETFGSLTVNKTDGALTISSTDIVTVTGTTTLTDSKVNGGSLVAQGNIVEGTAFDGGTTSLLISGTAAQTLTGSGSSTAGTLPALTVNKSAGTLTLASTIRTINNWTYTAGTVDPGSSTVVLGAPVTLAGAMTFNHLTTAVAGTYATCPSGVLAECTIVNGTLTVSDGALSAYIYLKGDVTFAAAADAGTATLEFIGTANQVYTNNSAATTHGHFKINKPAGTVTLASNLVMQSGYALVITSGTFDQGASFNVTISNGSATVLSTGIWKNLGTGTVTLAGGVTNNGVVIFNGGGSACGDADIAVASSVGGTQRLWTGSGIFSMQDVNVSDQGGTPTITVYSGTAGIGNAANWDFSAGVGCPGATTFAQSGYRWYENRIGTSLGNIGGVDSTYSANGVARDSTYFYTVGANGSGTPWRIEKRRLDTGALDASFGTNGVIIGGSDTNIAYAIAIDATYMYVVGQGTPTWRIEKRRLDTGALETAFDGDGIVNLAGTASALGIAIDATYMYLVGSDDTLHFRIEKRRLDTGALDVTFGSGGVIAGASVTNSATRIAIDGTFMYVFGSEGGSVYWRIEKRRLDTGVLDTAFDGDGIVTSTAGYAPEAIVIDANFLYAAGDGGGVWRIEKRRLDTGALNTAFGTNGVAGDAASATAHALALDGSYLYVAGTDNSIPRWRIEKRLISTGAVDGAFGTSGVITGDTTTNSATALVIDGTHMYVAGTESSGLTNWHMEKRLLSTGAPVWTDGTALAALNTAATGPEQGTPFRLRALLHIGTATAPINTAGFKLQVAKRSGTCDTSFTGETYADVSTTSGDIRFYDNVTASGNKPALTTATNDPTHGGDTVVAQSYQEANIFANNIAAIPANQDGLWDFSLVNAVGPQSTTYCFRVVKSDGSLLDTYSVIPEITTAAQTTSQSAYRWYKNTDSNELERIQVDSVGYFQFGDILVSGDSVYAASRSWQIEKRNATTMAREPTFGSNGLLLASSYAPFGLATDGTALYVMGDDASGNNSRIEKRLLPSGSLDTAFDTDGVVMSLMDSAATTGGDIALDATYMYVVTRYLNDWRIEKRTLNTGMLDPNFGAAGIVTGAASTYDANGIAIDSTFMYVVGTENGGTDWRIEKRRLDTGALETAFDTDGILTITAGAQAQGIAIDSTFMYVVGTDNSFNWRIEKRRLDTGAVDNNFGSSGVITSVAANQNSLQGAYDIAIDASNMYVVGKIPSGLRVEKRQLSDGTLVSSFGNGGAVTSSTGIDDYEGTAIGINTTYLFTVAGAQSNYAFGWLIERRRLSDGGVDDWIGPLASQDVPVTGVAAGAQVRLRMAAHLSSAAAIGGVSFKLQMAQRSGTCDASFTGETYADVSATSGAIRFYDNPTPPNASAVIASTNDPKHGSHTVVTQSYQEANPFSTTAAIAAGQDGLWDFSLINDSAPVGTTYCFRLVKEDGTLLDTYSVMPELTSYQTIVWNGAGVDGTCGGAGTANNWSCGANWSSGTAPASGDIATFDATSTKNATINSSITVGGIDINTGYTGIITQPAGIAVTVGSSGYDQAVGTFTGGDSAITINGNFSLTGGTFTSTSGTLSLLGNFTHTAGTFTHSSGTVSLDGGSGATVDVPTSDTFQNLTINKPNSSNVDIATGDTLIVLGTYTQTDGAVNTGTIEVRGATTTIGAAADASTATMSYLVTGDQTITGNGGSIGALNINKASGTVSAGSTNLSVASLTLASSGTGAFTSTSGTLTVRGNWTHTGGGTFNHNSGTVVFSGPASTVDVTTNETFNHLTVSKNNATALTIEQNDTLIVLGTFTHTDGSIEINNGIKGIEIRGAVTTIGPGADGGFAFLLYLVAGDQTITGNGGSTGRLYVDKSSGTLSAGSTDLSISTFDLGATSTFVSTSGQLTITGSSVDTWSHTAGGTFTHNSGTVRFTGSGGTNWYTPTGGSVFNNLVVNRAGGGAAQFSGGSALFIVQGTLELRDGLVNGGTIQARGDVIQDQAFDGGTGTVMMNGTGAQLLRGGESATVGNLPLMNINKTGGTVTLVGTIRTTNNWTFTSNVSGGAGSALVAGSSRVVFAGSLSITGSHTLYDVDFVGVAAAYTLSSATVLTTTGTLTLTDGSINTGTVEARGNVTQATTFDGGTGKLRFAGTNAQTLTGGGSAAAGTLPNVEINKSGNKAQSAFQNTSGLVGYWPFDEGTGTTTVDVSLSHNGTLTNGPVWTSGQFGQALSFDGASQYVSVTDPVDNSLDPDYLSVSVWFYLNSKTGSFPPLVKKSNGSVGYALELNSSSSYALQFYIQNASSSPSFVPSVNQWYHAVGTYDGSRVKLYVNGVEIGSPGTSTSGVDGNSTSNLEIGRDPVNTGRLFPGILDDVRIYNRALSAGEISTIYQAGASNELNLSSTIRTTNNWSYLAGTVNAGTSTVVFAAALTISGSPTFNNVTFNGVGTTYTIASGTTMTVAGTLADTDGLISTGTVAAQGNVTVATTADGGTGQLTFSGSANQLYTDSGGNEPDGNVTINKPSGTVTLASATQWNAAGQSLTITSGTLDQGASFDLLVGSGGLTVGADGRLTNTGSGDLNLAGAVTNNGIITMNGGGAACGDADNLLLIVSSVGGTQRAWSGTGIASIIDVTVSDQGGTAPPAITVYSGTAGTGNTAKWDFSQGAGCPATVAFTQSAYRWFENQSGLDLSILTSDVASSTPYAVAKDASNIYVVGSGGGRIEKRQLSDGALVTSFGTGGVVTSSGSSFGAALALDATYLYVAGRKSSGEMWRFEKRRLDTGAGDPNFGTGGILDDNFGPGSVCQPHAIAIDATYMYVVGDGDIGLWRIEKRRLDTGALETAFDTDGIVTVTLGNSAAASAIAIDATYMYVAGYDNNFDWRIEKRRLNTGALETAFNTTGIVTGAAASNQAQGIAIDATYMYVVGSDASDWRIEKRRLDTGALETAFNTTGIVTGAAASTIAYAIATDSTYMYVVGFEGSFPYDWRIEKRRLDTGALETAFDTDGIVTASAASSIAYGIVLDATNMYVVGDNSNSDWLFEKRRLSDGVSVWDGTKPLAAQDTAAIAQGTPFRLRQLLHIGTNTLVANTQAFKLQVAQKSGTCDTAFTGETYADVSASSGAMRFYDNAPADGATMITATGDPTHGVDTIINQTYEEANNFTNAVANIPAGQDGKWDFALVDSAAAPGTSYCFRVVKSDSTLLDTYSVIPEITTVARTVAQSAYRWYSNLDSTDFSALGGNANARSLTGAMAMDANELYSAGRGPSGQGWHIEKRRLTTGTLDTSYGTGGASDTTLYSGFTANAMAIDSAATYVVGSDGSTTWLIDKRLRSTGALDTGFDTDGFVAVASGTAHAIALDATSMYVVGYEGTSPYGWRIEKRKLSDAALCTAAACGTAFDTDGIVTGVAGTSGARGIAIDATYMYVVGYNSAFSDWRIEKRRLDTGALETAFDTDGIVTSVNGGTATAIALDATYMYVVGSDASDWRIEKRLLTTGALDTNFGTSGVVTGAAASNTARAIALDATYLYVVGDEGSPSDWRIEKRRLDTGALETAFDTDGILTGPTFSNTAYKIAIVGSSMVVTGTDSDSTGNWRIERRLLSTGALVWAATPLANQDTAAIAPDQGIPFRLRLLLHIGSALNTSGDSFKLQVAQRSGTCDAGFVGETYADVSPTSGAIRFYDNLTPADGEAFVDDATDPTHGGDVIVSQRYEEANPFTNSVAAILSGQDGKWDFALVDNSATAATSYCFRVVRSDDSQLNTYSVIPEITTSAPNRRKGASGSHPHIF